MALLSHIFGDYVVVQRRLTKKGHFSIEQQFDGYLAYFPALKGYNTWGKTYEEAIKHAGRDLDAYSRIVR